MNLKQQSPYVHLYSVQKNEFQKIVDGQVIIETIVDDRGVYYTSLEFHGFKIQLQQDTYFIETQLNDNYQIAFPIPNMNYTGFYVIAVSNKERNKEELIRVLKNIFQVYNKENIVENIELQNSIKENYENFFKDSILLGETSNLNYYIEKTGYSIGVGFEWLGEKASIGTEFLGNKIVDKIQPNKKEISQECKQKLESKKNKTKRFFKKIGDFIEKALTPIANISNVAIDGMVNKTKNSENENLKYLYYCGKSMNSACTNVYRGLTKGGKELGNSLGCNSRKIITKKYGKEFSNTYLGENNQNNTNRMQQDNNLSEQLQQQLIENNQEINNQLIQQKYPEDPEQNSINSQQQYINYLDNQEENQANNNSRIFTEDSNQSQRNLLSKNN